MSVARLQRKDEVAAIGRVGERGSGRVVGFESLKMCEDLL
jgi:hypothetical protein